ncbi:MAG: hypothetical protein GY834_16895 [Bacteroidetes bacterium]|nr:hypothetical protein [Bacteroidota bacterium]
MRQTIKGENHISDYKKSQRIEYLDFARGLAILFMILQHSLIVYAVNGGEATLLGGIFLLSVDIFQLAGLSLIFMSLIRYFLPRQPWTCGEWFSLLLIIMIVLVVSPLLWGKFGNNPFLSPFLGDGETKFFPFFPWVVYPVFGMFLSRFLLNPKDNLFFKNFIIAGFSLIIIGTALWTQVSNAIIVQGDYHRSGIAVHFVIIGFILIWLPFCETVFNQTSQYSFIYRILFFWSRNTTVVYFIQWVLYGWGILIFGCESLPVTISLFVGIGMCILCHALTKIFVKLRERYQSVC